MVRRIVKAFEMVPFVWSRTVISERILRLQQKKGLRLLYHLPIKSFMLATYPPLVLHFPSLSNKVRHELSQLNRRYYVLILKSRKIIKMS